MNDVNAPHKPHSNPYIKRKTGRKPYKRYPTPRQKIAAKLMAENLAHNLGKTTGQVLLEAGYDKSTSEVPTIITNSQGYQSEYNKYGLNEQLIVSALVEDINKKPQKRVEELKLASEITGIRKQRETPQNTLNIALFSTEQQERIAQRIIENIAQRSQEKVKTD